jgi:hypothetical protein
MPIAIECRGCGFRADVPDVFAGRAAKCRRCGARVGVPAGEGGLVAAAIPELDTARVAFPSIATDDAEGPAARPPRDGRHLDAAWAIVAGPEPWYYRFLAGYAYLILGSGVLAGSLWLAASILVASAAPDPEGAPLRPLTLALAAVPAIGLVLGSLLVAAPILLAVDAARTLRAIRAGR